MRRALPTEAEYASNIMASELEAYLKESGAVPTFSTPSGGALEAAMVAGLVRVYLDDADPRVVCSVQLDKARNPTRLFVDQVWGPSEKHAHILEDLTDVLIADRLGDVPVSYPRIGTPLTQVADEKAITPDKIDADQKTATTTARIAKALLLAARVRP